MDLSYFHAKNKSSLPHDKIRAIKNGCSLEFMLESEKKHVLISNLILKYNLIFNFNKEKLLEATNFLKEHHEQLVTTNIFLYSNSNRQALRGLLLLPEKIDENFIRRPDAFHLDKKLCLHMSCLNVKSKFLSEISKIKRQLSKFIQLFA
jgi:hypothetical protein